MNIESFRQLAAQAGERALVAALPVNMEILATLTAILTRCDDLDAMCAADGRLDRVQVGIDSRRIREMAEKARTMVVTP